MTISACSRIAAFPSSGNLHEDAAMLHRIGNSTAAETFLQIADAAEREWSREAAGITAGG